MKQTVIKLQNTCIAEPSQWHGTTNKKEHIYIRYRNGRLQFGIDKNYFDAVGNRKDVPYVSTNDDFISKNDMMTALSPYLEFQLIEE